MPEDEDGRGDGESRGGARGHRGAGLGIARERLPSQLCICSMFCQIVAPQQTFPPPSAVLDGPPTRGGGLGGPSETSSKLPSAGNPGAGELSDSRFSLHTWQVIDTTQIVCRPDKGY